MRRLIATLAVMVALVWAYQTGYSARRAQDNVAHAQGGTATSDRSFTDVEQLPSDDPPRSEPIGELVELVDLPEAVTSPHNAVNVKKCMDDVEEEAGDSPEKVKRPLDAKSFTNRFDRGALSEDFDGEIFRGRRPQSNFLEKESFSLSDPVAAETAAPPALDVGDQLVQATPGDALNNVEQDFPAPVPRKGQLIPVAPNSKLAPNYSDPQTATGKLIAGSTRRVPVTPPRVMLSISKDHQISVRPEARILSESIKEMPAGSIIVIAEEFSLVPPSAPAAGNQVTCTGNVQLISQNVVATCTKLTFKGSSLVLEGTPQHRVEVKRQAAGDAAEFQLSADKISFTLSLDKIEIGGGVTVSPALATESVPAGAFPAPAPPVPANPKRVRPELLDDASDPTNVPKRKFDDEDDDKPQAPPEGDDKKALPPDVVPPVAPELPNG